MRQLVTNVFLIFFPFTIALTLLFFISYLNNGYFFSANDFVRMIDNIISPVSTYLDELNKLIVLLTRAQWIIGAVPLAFFGYTLGLPLVISGSIVAEFFRYLQDFGNVVTPIPVIPDSPFEDVSEVQLLSSFMSFI